MTMSPTVLTSLRCTRKAILTVLLRPNMSPRRDLDFESRQSKPAFIFQPQPMTIGTQTSMISRAATGAKTPVPNNTGHAACGTHAFGSRPGHMYYYRTIEQHSLPSTRVQVTRLGPLWVTFHLLSKECHAHIELDRSWQLLLCKPA